MQYLSLALSYLFPGILFNIEVILQDDGNGPYIKTWNRPEPQPTEAELLAAVKPAMANIKREEIYREQEIRSTIVYGKEVDRFFFAWIEELYSKILKPASRNAIDAVNTPITNGLKNLRDNRNTLLSGLETWVNDPLKTADDIAGFDVVNWSGWSVARP